MNKKEQGMGGEGGDGGQARGKLSLYLLAAGVPTEAYADMATIELHRRVDAMI